MFRKRRVTKELFRTMRNITKGCDKRVMSRRTKHRRYKAKPSVPHPGFSIRKW